MVQTNAPQTNIKTPHSGAFEYWLREMCSSRAELVEIGQEIDEVKNKLNLRNLNYKVVM
jgi:hypothetical protein